MIFENARLLLRLLWRPADAMSAILDQGSLLFASAAVLVISLLLQFSLSPRLPQAPVPVQQTQAARGDEDQPNIPAVPARPRWSFSFYTPLLVLAVVYVPGTLLVTSVIARLGGFGAVFQRDYSSLLTCTSMAWAAANLPVVVAGWVAPLPVLAGVAVAACVYFAVLCFSRCALSSGRRTV